MTDILFISHVIEIYILRRKLWFWGKHIEIKLKNGEIQTLKQINR